MDGNIRKGRESAAFPKRPRDTATIEDVRRLQLHLLNPGAGPAAIQATTTGLKLLIGSRADGPSYWPGTVPTIGLVMPPIALRAKGWLPNSGSVELVSKLTEFFTVSTHGSDVDVLSH